MNTRTIEIIFRLSAENTYRVFRGSSWDDVLGTRSALRGINLPYFRDCDTGFRLVQEK